MKKTRILACIVAWLVVALQASAVDINGQLKKADLEAISSDPSSPSDGRIYLNTTSHKAKYRSNSAWLTVVDTTHALLTVMTTTGDIIYSSDGSGTPARLAVGGANTVLHGGTTPSYSAVTTGDFSGQLAAAKGGTGVNSTATFPSSGIVVTETATETLTNKTLTSPTMTAPVLGTPASGTLTNATGLPLTTGVTGTLPAANGGTGVANNAASTLAISGSFATTLTVTGITGVTLPTTGTLLANSRAINTTAPLAGGGDLSADRTLSIPVAATAANGYLSSTDWNTFNTKVGTARAINTTAPITGGGDLSADRTIAMAAAATAANGYLSSTDWNTFNGKLTSPLTTKGDVLVFSTVADRLPAGSNGNVLSADSTASTGLKWIAAGGTGTVTSVDLTMPGVFAVTGNPVTTTGTLAVAASGTSGGIPYFSTSSTMASSAALASNQVVRGGGAGTTPATGGSTYIIGTGEAGTPSAVTFRGPAASGANVAGANLTVDASNGTGTGGSGKIIFRIAPVAGSSSSANTLAEIMTVRNDGYVVVGTGDATATTTNGIIAGASRTGANAAGSNLYLIAPNGTGSGGSGNVIFQTAPVAGSSSSANTFTDVLTVKKDGSVVVGNGDGTATTSNGLISGAARTGANALGSDVYLQASNGTGTAGSGNLIFQTGAGAGSSSTAATLATAMQITNTQDVVIGGGEASGTTTNGILRGAARTGSNAAGSNLTIDAPNGTGTGGSGSLIFRTAPAAGSSSSADTETTALTIANTGGVTIAKTGGNVPFACTKRVAGTASSSSSSNETCSTNEIVLGGGCEIVSGTATNLQQSYPSSTTTWQCNWSGATGNVRAYAICCTQ